VDINSCQTGTLVMTLVCQLCTYAIGAHVVGCMHVFCYMHARVASSTFTRAMPGPRSVSPVFFDSRCFGLKWLVDRLQELTSGLQHTYHYNCTTTL
jgi:hypothetical protein